MIFNSDITGRPSECSELCDPMTALAIIGTGMQALGAIQQGNAAKAEADYQAGISEQNADISAQQTAAAVEVQDRERRLRRGANIAKAGASGTGLDSFGDILASNAMQEKLDIMTLESEGLLQRRNFEADAALSKARGKSAQMSGYISAGTKVLGGFSSFGSSGKLGNQKIETTDYLSSGARKDIRYSKGGGYGPYRY